MAMQHTAGPWRVGSDSHHMTRREVRGARGELVAMVPQNPADDMGAMPDARLIAAAPCLLAALREAQNVAAMQAMAQMPGAAPLSDAEIARILAASEAVGAAIAKAEGQ